MEGTYNTRRLKLYEKRAELGRALADRAVRASDRCRQMGKSLKVVSYPQGGQRVPSVRVAGKWLERLGFELAGEVILKASEGQITITRKEASEYGSSVV